MEWCTPYEIKKIIDQQTNVASDRKITLNEWRHTQYYVKPHEQQEPQARIKMF